MSDIDNVTTALSRPRAETSLDGGSRKVALEPFIALKRHRVLGALTFILTFCAGALGLHNHLKPVYEARTVIYVSPIFPKELADDREHDRQYDTFMEQQITAVPQYETLREALNAVPGVWRHPDESEQDAIGRLQKNLKVAQMGHSYLVSISLQANTPNKLAEFVNKITEVYLRKARQEEFFGTDERLATLGAEKAKVQQLLFAKLKEQDTLLRAVGMAHLDSKLQSNPFDSELSKLHEELAAAHATRESAEARVAMLDSNTREPRHTILDDTATTELNSDPSLSSLRIQLAVRRATLLQEMNGLTPQNPLWIQARSQLQEIDKQVESVTAEYKLKKLAEIRERYAAARDERAAFESQVAGDVERVTARVASAAPKLQQAELVNADIERVEAAYAVLDSRIESLTLEGSSPGSIHLDSQALTPQTPAPNKAPLLYGGLVFFSLLASFAIPVFANLVDTRLYTPSDVSRISGFPPLGVLINRSDFGQRLESEYFIRFAGGMEHALRSSIARSFLFTAVGSTDTEELTNRVGQELAKAGLGVLILHLANPTVHDAEMEQQIRTHSIPPAGARPVTSDNANATVPALPVVLTIPTIAAAQYIRDTESLYDSVLISGQPILTSSASENLARVADGTVIVIDSGTTTKKQMRRTVALLQRLDIAGLGIVLRKVSRRTSDYELLQDSTD